MAADRSASRSATIVGGGPAGLMAAEVLATSGIAVTLFEHMPSVGRKLLLAGRSGLNITHAESLAQLAGRYGAAPTVAAAVRAFTPTDLRTWATGLGEATFVGPTGRVFPVAMRATPLLRAWLARLGALGVRIETSHRWLGWEGEPTSAGAMSRLRFHRHDDSTISVGGDVVVFALGGASWPRVGSDGAWTTAFRGAGIAVSDLRPANCGLRILWSERFTAAYSGAPLKNVSVGVLGEAVRGDITVTAGGLESGPVYTVSAAVRDRIDMVGSCPITIDLLPDLSVEEVATRLRRGRQKDSQTNALRRALGLPPIAAALLREATENSLPTAASDLAELVKAVPFAITATAGIARAISTAGGISMAETDDHFMLRRLPGVFVAGEMLDWEAPTGGYLLQASFSTAVVAARAAAAWPGAEA